MKFAQNINDIDLALSPQEDSIDEETTEVNDAKEAKNLDKPLEILDGLVMPYCQLDSSKYLSIDSGVCHGNNGHVCQWNDGFNTFCQNELFNSFYREIG